MAPIVLVTGADGFVGRHMVSALTRAGWHVRCAQRSVGSTTPNANIISGLELGSSTNWQPALTGVQAVVHLAARAHRSKPTQKRESDLYFSINVEGTIQLARSAIAAGVRDFIFLSSIAVNGSTTDGRKPFCEQDSIAPDTVYGKSKAIAEQRLRHVLHTLRRALPEADRYLEVGQRTLRWRADAPCRLDVATFEEALARADAGGADDAAAALRDAVEVYAMGPPGGLLRRVAARGERERLRVAAAEGARAGWPSYSRGLGEHALGIPVRGAAAAAGTRP